MEKCINNYYVCNGEVKKSDTFLEKNIIGETNIYEVIRIIDGVPLFLEDHLERMAKTFKFMDIYEKFNFNKIEDAINKLIDSNDRVIGNIKIIYVVEKNILSAYYIKHAYPSDELYKKGVKTILFYGERENPNAKIINNTFREKVNESIKKNNAYEAILIDKQSRITEGSKSNIFMVKGDCVITSPVEAVLPGITRKEIIDVCDKLNIKVKEKYLNDTDIKDIDGLFISGTSPKVLPINQVDDCKYSSTENKIILDIMKGYNKEINDYLVKKKMNK